VSIAYQNVENKTIEEGSNYLENYINQNKTSSLKLASQENQSWEIELEKLDFFYDTNLSVEKAYQVGRNKKPFLDLKNKTKSYFQGTNLGLDYSLNQNLLEQKTIQPFITAK